MLQHGNAHDIEDHQDKGQDNNDTELMKADLLSPGDKLGEPKAVVQAKQNAEDTENDRQNVSAEPSAIEIVNAGSAGRKPEGKDDGRALDLGSLKPKDRPARGDFLPVGKGNPESLMT